MIFFQYLANGLILGGLYACIAAGFSLVWGVLNIINLLHGSFIVLGFYIAYFSYTLLRHSSVPVGDHVGTRARGDRLLRPARHHQPRRRRIGAGHADPDLRPRIDDEQRDAGVVLGRLPQGHAAQLARRRAVRQCLRPARSRAVDRDRLPADLPALAAAAADLGRPRHRRGAVRPRGGAADGHRREPHLCDHLCARRGDGRLRPAACSACPFRSRRSPARCS